MINYGKQSITVDDIEAVVKTLSGDWLTQGPTIERFEREVADYVGAEHAVAFANGTAALHGAAAASGLGPSDLVATTPLTFMASVNALRYVNVSPLLIDISPETLNLDVANVPIDIDGLMAVHFAGLPVDLDSLQSRPRVVIEDAAHALGASTPSGRVGNCAHSEMTCFSFHPVKPITTGEGGIVTTNNNELAEYLRRFRSHGIVRKPDQGAWYYEISDVGFNYRLTDIQAALGLSQLKKLESFIDRRNELADRYRELLSGLPIQLPPIAPKGFVHGYHLFVIRVRNRRTVFERLIERGIGVQVHYVPVHHHPISADIQIISSGLENCDAYYERALSLPIYPDLTGEDQQFVAETLYDILV